MLLTFHRHRRSCGALALVALTALQACYSYVPLAETATPRVGERVRATLTAGGSTELARYLGPNIAIAEGRLTAIDSAGGLVVAIDQVRTMSGVVQPWTGEGVVTLPRAQMSSLAQRAFQRNRTIVASALGVLALMTIAVIALRSGGAGGGGEIPPPPPP